MPMTHYAHTSDPTPRRIPSTWNDGTSLHMGLPAMSPAQLAALGWYPVHRAEMEPGAPGYGPMVFDEEQQAFVIPSLPGDPAVVEQQRIDAMTVTALQGMLAINQAGMAAGFNAWKASLDPVNDFAVIAFFEKAQSWRRDNPYLIQGATALGLTEAQIDELFTLARTL